MQKFQKITMIDITRLTQQGIEEIKKISTEPMVLHWSYPSSEQEVIERIGDSDAVLVSFSTQLTPSIIAAAPKLKYIGMCCSLFSEETSNVNIPASRAKGIVVKGVKDYGDEGVVELIFSQLIGLCKGIDGRLWKEEASELSSKTLGIVGMGTVGRMVARTARCFGMKVVYFSRTRKPDVEADGIQYMPLKGLLAVCDAITLHLPRYTVALGKEEFACMKKNAVLINTSFGPIFDKDAFVAWMASDSSAHAIFDADGAGLHYEEFSGMKNVFLYERSAGFTRESKERLSQKALDNMRVFLETGK